jgi:hypothetical protein
MTEIREQPARPVAIYGDFNTEHAQLSALNIFIDQWHFIDLGEAADACGQPKSAPTCYNHVAIKPSRIDHALVSDFLFLAVWNFQVFPDDICPMHATIMFQIVYELVPCKNISAIKVGSLRDKCEEHVFKVFGPPLKPLFSGFGNVPSMVDGEPEFNQIQHAHFLTSSEAQGNKILQQVHAAKMGVLFQNLLELQDSFVKAKASILETAIARKELNTFWITLWGEVERSLAHLSGTAPCEAKVFLGRGKVMVREVQAAQTHRGADGQPRHAWPNLKEQVNK